MKRTDSESVIGDGFSFNAQSTNAGVTTGERLRDFHEEFVYEPGLVVWNDVIAVPMVFLMFLGLALAPLAQGLDRAFDPRIRTRLAGESETTTAEDDDTQFMVGV